ncbi:amidohydrolase family protein [Chloroflexota bacterium]
MLDLLLCGGSLIDGTGAPQRLADVGVRDERVVAVGDLRRSRAQRRVDVSGLFVAPGFIDIHAHSELTRLVDPRAASKAHQGITTEICGLCGLSAAPLVGVAKDELALFGPQYGLKPSWDSIAGYLEAIEREGMTLNFGSFAGHGNLRGSVIGGADRPPTATEQDAMAGILAQALEEGALGLSSGLFYTPGFYAKSGELAALGQVVAAYGGLYTTHVRNEGRLLENALQEATDVGRASGVPVQISHLKLASRAHWGQAERVLAWLDSARAEGLDVGWDQYPYAAAATTLEAAVPPQFHDGGTTALLQQLRNPQDRADIAHAISTDTESDWENMTSDSGWDNLLLSFHPTRPDLVGRTIADIAATRRADPLETVLDLILETKASASIVDFCMDERDVATILCHPRTIVVTDAEALAADGPLSVGTPHPRAYGTYPRVLSRYVRERGLLTWEEAIHKMTCLPAERVGLRDRGVVREGAFADLVVLDPDTIADRATYSEPHQYPAGIHYVLVNGRFVVQDGVQTDERPGRVLRREG